MTPSAITRRARPAVLLLLLLGLPAACGARTPSPPPAGARGVAPMAPAADLATAAPVSGGAESTPAVGGPLPVAEVPVAAGQPRLWVDGLGPPDFRFEAGELPPDRPSRWVFTLRNVGEGPLTLDGAGSSCPCLAVATDRTVLAPGESTALRVAYEPRIVDELGPVISHLVRLETNDPERPLAEFLVTGRRPGQQATWSAAATAEGRGRPAPWTLATQRAAAARATETTARATDEASRARQATSEARRRDLPAARALRAAYAADDLEAARAVLEAWHQALPPIGDAALAALPADQRDAYEILARFYGGEGWTERSGGPYVLVPPRLRLENHAQPAPETLDPFHPRLPGGLRAILATPEMLAGLNGYLDPAEPGDPSGQAGGSAEVRRRERFLERLLRYPLRRVDVEAPCCGDLRSPASLSPTMDEVVLAADQDQGHVKAVLPGGSPVMPSRTVDVVYRRTAAGWRFARVDAD